MPVPLTVAFQPCYFKRAWTNKHVKGPICLHVPDPFAWELVKRHGHSRMRVEIGTFMGVPLDLTKPQDERVLELNPFLKFFPCRKHAELPTAIWVVEV